MAKFRQMAATYAFSLPHRVITRHADKLLEASIAAGFEKLIGFAVDFAPHVIRGVCLTTIGHSTH